MSDFYEEVQPRLTAEEFEEALDLLVDRWIRNDLSFSLLEDSEILDMGCRSGRYSYALSQLGAEYVVGIDADRPDPPEGIDTTNIEFQQGNILNLSFDDNRFDFVYCNGTLTHTEDWHQGIKEAHRVLKPGGWLWLYVARKHESWERIDRIREKMAEEDGEIFKRYLLWRGVRPGRAFWLTDIFFVSDRFYRTQSEVESALKEFGFGEVRFLGEFAGQRAKTGLRALAQK